MIRKTCHESSSINDFLRMGLLLLILLLGIGTAKAQNCPEITGKFEVGMDPIGLDYCAPVEFTLKANVQLRYKGCTPGIITFEIDWGDFTTQTVSPTTVTDNGSLGGADFWYYTLSVNHEYKRGFDVCTFPVAVTLKENGKKIYTQTTNAERYHQVDDYWGARNLIMVDEKTGHNVFLVCEGQEVRIKFQDLSELNCNFPEPGIKRPINYETRYLQFEYGTTGSNIPDVFVAGSQITGAAGSVLSTRIDGGDTYAPNTVWKSTEPAPMVTGRLTNEVYIAAGTTMGHVGKEFYITLYNWNKCNELANKTNPTAADRAYARTTTALIRVVAQPPKPDDVANTYCNRIGNNYPDAHYAVTVPHAAGAMKPGYYLWYRDDGSGGPGMPGHPDLNNLLFRTESSSPNSLLFNPVTKFPTTSQDYLNPTIAQKKFYWVVYYYENPAAGANPYPKLCGSDPALIAYTIREDISSPPPAQPALSGCSGEIFKIYANGGAPAPVYPVGKATQYVWTDLSGFTETDRAADGHWIEVQATVSSSVPHYATASVKVHLQWTTAPNCPGAARQLSAQINPKPVATLTGGGTICPDEDIELTVKGIKGLGSNKAFSIEITGAAPVTTTLPSVGGDYKIIVNPANNTVTEYSFVKLTDIGTGCSSVPAATQTVVKRAVLNTSTFAIDGANQVCEHTAATYSVNPPGGNPANVNIGIAPLQVSEATRYLWSLDGAAGTPSSVGNKVLSATDIGAAPATKNIAVVWQYANMANRSNKADKYCPSLPVAKTIEVVPKPTVKVNDNSLTRTVCKGSGTTIDIDLTGIPNKDWEVQWSVSGWATEIIPGTASGKATYSVTIPNTTIPNPGSYTFTLRSVTQVAAGGCAGAVLNPKEAKIRVLKTPVADIPTQSKQYCSGTAVEIPLTLTGENTGTYQVQYQIVSTAHGTLARTVNVDWDQTPHKLVIGVAEIDQNDGSATTITILNVTEHTLDLNSNPVSCSGTVSGVYTITTLANLPNINAGPDYDVCDLPAAYNLNTSGVVTAPPASYKGEWFVVSRPPAGGSFNPVSKDIPGTIYTPNAGGIHVLEWVIQSNPANICPAKRDTVILSWGVTANQPVITPVPPVCYDINQPLLYAPQLNGSAPRPNIEMGEWTKQSGPGNVSFTDKTDNNTKVTVTAYGTYVLQWTFKSGSCPPEHADVTVVFNELPVQTVIPTQEYCPAEATTMPAFAAVPAVPALDFSWKFTSTAMLGFTPNGSGNFPNAPAPANNTTLNRNYQLEVTAKIAATGCTSKQLVDIRLKPQPQMVVMNDDKVCEGTDIEFKLSTNLNGDVTFNWNNDQAIGLPLGGPTLPVPSPYIHKFTTTNPSPAHSRVSVTAHITNLTASVNGCKSVPQDFDLTVDPTPVLTMPVVTFCPEEDVPAGATKVISDVAGATFYWSSGGQPTGITSPAGNADNVGDFKALENTSNFSFKQMITVQVTAGKCMVQDSYELELKPRLNLNPVGSQTVCSAPVVGAFVVPFGAANSGIGVAGYTWTGTDYLNAAVTGSDPAQATISWVVDNQSGTDRVWQMEVTGEAANGCLSKPVPFKLTLHPRPKLIVEPQTICSGQQFTAMDIYANDGGNTVRFDWNNDNTNTGIPVSGTQILPNPWPIYPVAVNTSSVPIVSTIIVKGTSPNRCEGDPTTFTMTINPAPDLNPLNPLPVCPGIVVPQNNFGTSNIPAGDPLLTYTWSISDPSVGIGLPATVSDTVAMRSFIAGNNNTPNNKRATVSVTATYDKCPSAVKKFEVILKPKPEVLPVSNKSVCPGSAVQLPGFRTSVHPLNDTGVSWKLDNGNIGNPVITPLLGNGSIPGFTAANNTTGSDLKGIYTVIANIDGCESDELKFEVLVQSTPDVRWAVAPPAGQPPFYYCDNELVAIPGFASSDPKATFKWTTDNKLIGTSLNDNGSGAQIPPFTSVNNTAGKLAQDVAHFSVIASTTANCPGTPMLFDVIIRPVPRLDASANISVCAGTPVPSAPFNVTPAPGAGDVTSFSWAITDYATAIASDKLNGLAPGNGVGNLPAFTPETLQVADPGAPWPWKWHPFWGDSVRRYHVDVDVHLNGCPANGVQKLFIDIKPLPVTTITAEHDACVEDGDLKTFSADFSESGTPGSDYIWDVAQYAPPVGAAYAPVPLSPADLSFAKVYQYPSPMNGYWKGYITVKEQNRYGCTAPEVSLLTEAIPAPIADAGPDMTVCSGIPIKLQGSVTRRSVSVLPITAEWRPPVYVQINGNEQTFEPTVLIETPSLTPVVFKMWVVAREGSCVSKPDEVEITVNPTPLRPELSNQAYCSSVTQMDMTVLNAGGNDIHWYRVAGADIPIPTANNLTTVNMRDKATHPNALPPTLNYVGARKEAFINYKVISENAYHCVSPPKEVTLTVMKIADRPTPGGPFEYCKNTNTVFNVSASGMDGNFTWYNDTITMVPQQAGDATYSVQVTTPGSYEYYVTQTGVNGCRSYPIGVPMEILPNPALSFTFTDAPGGNAVTYGCADWLVYATNTSTNPAGTVYNWRWDDGKPGDSAPEGVAVAHTYENTWPFAVDVKPMLTGVSDRGCQSVLEQTLEILPYIKADFTPSPDEGCSPLTANFLNPTSADRFNWFWDRAVAPTAADMPDYTGKNVSKTFVNTTGLTETYHVWLYAENGSGAKKCSSVKDAFVTVHPQPNVSFTHDAAAGICSPNRVLFTNTSPNNPASTVYTLRYGDQFSDLLAVGDTISHPYRTSNMTPITVSPSLTAANIIGVYTCESETYHTITVNPPVKADFTGPTDGCSPFLAEFTSQSSLGVSNFSWTFTGADIVNPLTPLNVHTPRVELTNTTHTTVAHVTVKLDVSNNYGCAGTISKSFLLNPQPAVSFVMDKIMGCPPLDVTFTNTSNGNPAGGMTYTFEFEDAAGDVSTTPVSVSHTYTNLLSQNASVKPKLTAKNQWNCTNEIPGLITIYPYIVADFRMSDSIACPPLAVNFTNGSKGHSSLDWRINGATWASWVQGGGSAAGLNPSYTFTNSNMLNDDHYQVELVASNGQCTDTRTRQVLIYRKPIPDFTASPMVQYYPGSTVAVTNKISNNATVVNSFQYNWQLSEQGSGISNTFSTLPNPGAETIGKWGIFDIIQAVYAEHCSDQKTLTVSIIPPVPLSGFDSIPPACMPYEVQFNNTSKNANTYFWDFGDGFTSNVEHPIHLYPDAGTYTVTLTIKGDGGTTSSKRKVVVHPMPRAEFEVKPDFLWVGQDLRAFPYTSNTTSSGRVYDIWYRWDWGDNSAIDTARQPLHMYRKAGKYDVTLTIGTYTSPQCIHSFTLENAIELQNAGDIILPNSFKPWETGQTDGAINNEGYQNNLFYPPVLSPTRKYSFVVYNRWGQLLFETTDPGIGWDGYFKGKLCDEGVYIYKIEGVFETGQSFSKMGDILLLR